MRILLLGGAGFIGVHLARRLVSAGHLVTVVDDFSRGREDDELAELGTSVLHADLTQAAAFEHLPHGWDQVYMLAAVVGVRNVERDPYRVINVNAGSLLHLLEWLRPGGRLFFASTSEVYAGGVGTGSVPVPTPEDVPLVIENVASPRSAYAVSKLMSEAAVSHAARAKGIPYVIARFHNVYGPRMGTDHVIPELSLRALQRPDPFPVYGVGQSRAFCYVEDAVDAMQRLMQTDAAMGRIVNIGNDTETGIDELARLVLRIAGHDAEVAALPAPPDSVDRRCPDISRLRTLTGFEPKVALEEGVRRTFDWYADHMGPARPNSSTSRGLSVRVGRDG
jgi:UDP-glucose 4-epimerase/UDP-glucuronate decarboxylase